MKRLWPKAKVGLDLALVSCAALLLQGCLSMAARSIKTYPARAEWAVSASVSSPNAYQADFLTLIQFASEAFPLQDRYFPAEERAKMEQAILQRLGEPGCTDEAFTLSLRQYLARYNNEHAAVVYNPKPAKLYGYYPFRPHYVSNQLYVLNLSTNYPASALDRKIIAINQRPVEQVERRLASFFSAENETTKRKALELPPHPYVRPDFYRFAGLADSSTNSLVLGIEDHPEVVLDPIYSNAPAWHRRPPTHPITARSSHLYDHRTFSEQHLAYLQFNACFDKIAVEDGLTMMKPWLRPLARVWLGMQFLSDSPAEILRGHYDPTRPVFRDFLAEAIGDINSQGITNLIIDLRHNGGGEVSLCYQLLYHLRDRITDSSEYRYNPAVMAFYQPRAYKRFRERYRRENNSEPPPGEIFELNETERASFRSIQDFGFPYYIAPNRPVFSGRVVVLVDHRTRSAASQLAGLMQDNGIAQVVGTTTGNNPTGPTGMTLFRLPRSGILITLPTEFDRRADPAKGDFLVPDYWVEATTADVASGIDPVFNKAVEVLLRK